MTSVFESYKSEVYKHRFEGTLLARNIAGGVPADPNVIQKWIESKFKDNDQIIRELVAQAMVDTEVGADEAAEKVAEGMKLNRFRRDEQGLFIRGYQLKACLKEAASIRWAKDRWGETRKGTRSFMPEHLFIEPDKLHLGVAEPTAINQRFVVTWRGTGIQYEELVEEAKISFTLLTDWNFTDEQWGHLWVTAEKMGIGATRSQGYGEFQVIEWSRVEV